MLAAVAGPYLIPRAPLLLPRPLFCAQGVICNACPAGAGKDGAVCVQCPHQIDNSGILAAYVVGLIVVISVVIANTIVSAHATSFADAQSSASFFARTLNFAAHPFSSSSSSSRAQLRSSRRVAAGTGFWGEDVERTLRSERLTSMAALRAAQRKHGSLSGREVNLKLVGTALLKQVITFSQLLSFMSELRINWPQVILDAFELAGKYTSPTLQLASVDCAIQANAPEVPPYFGRLVTLAVMPLFTVLAAGLLWLVVWAVWSTSQYRALSSWWANWQANRQLAALNEKNLRRAARGEAEKELSEANAARVAAADAAASLTPAALRSRAYTNFLITAMALLFLQHSPVAKASFTFFSCRWVPGRLPPPPGWLPSERGWAAFFLLLFNSTTPPCWRECAP
jgi:hypothetical protein